jgi:hypothetical protein
VKWIPRLVQGLAGLAGTVILALVGAGRPTNYWEGSEHDWIIWLGVVGVVVAAVLTPLVQAIDAHFKARSEAFGRKVSEVIAGVLVEIHRLPDIDITQLGIHAFEVNPRWYPIPLPKVLKRRARVRLRPSTRSGPVVWKKGKGLIGLCWQTSKRLEADLGPVLFPDGTYLTRERWNALPALERMGMKYRDYQHTSAGGVIVVQPVFLNGDFAGCISLDGPTGLTTLQSSPEVMTALESASTSRTT